MTTAGGTPGSTAGGPTAAGPGDAVRRELAARGQTLCCAESLTGGELAALLSAPAGASATFVGGVVSYATSVKRDVLGVSAERVVSAESAGQMAEGVRRLLGADWAVSTTGVAGPERQEGRPVGTVHVGVAGPARSRTREVHVAGDRAAVRRGACEAALHLLEEEVGRG